MEENVKRKDRYILRKRLNLGNLLPCTEAVVDGTPPKALLPKEYPFYVMATVLLAHASVWLANQRR